jgi:hypothetical protein
MGERRNLKIGNFIAVGTDGQPGKNTNAKNRKNLNHQTKKRPDRSSPWEKPINPGGISVGPPCLATRALYPEDSDPPSKKLHFFQKGIFSLQPLPRDRRFQPHPEFQWSIR